jgi:hypothetical protein
MTPRRRFLRSAALAALGLLLPGAAPAAAVPAGPPAGRFFLVDGWILTAEDVAALRPGGGWQGGRP